jgi:hypothetical protein
MTAIYILGSIAAYLGAGTLVSIALVRVHPYSIDDLDRVLAAVVWPVVLLGNAVLYLVNKATE